MFIWCVDLFMLQDGRLLLVGTIQELSQRLPAVLLLVARQEGYQLA